MLNTNTPTLLQKPQRQMNLYDINFNVMLFAYIFGVIARITDSIVLERIGSYLFMFNIICGILGLFFDRTSLKKKGKIILIIYVLSPVFAIAFSEKSVSYDNFTTLINFYQVPFFCYNFNRITKIKERASTVRKIFTVLSLIFIAMSFSPKFYTTDTLSSSSIGDFILIFNNTNETGIFLYTCAMIFASRTAKASDKKASELTLPQITNNLIRLTVFAVLAYLTYRTGSRTSFFAIVIALILYLINSKHTTSKIIKYVIIAIPIIFSWFYLANQSFIKQFDVMGRSLLGGRVVIYESVLKDIIPAHFFFGRFTYYSYNNSHNVFLSVLATSGIIGAVIFFIWVFYTYNRIDVICSNAKKKFSFFALLCVMICSSVESGWFCSGGMIASNFAFLYLMCLKDSDSDDPKLTASKQRTIV